MIPEKIKADTTTKIDTATSILEEETLPNFGLQEVIDVSNAIVSVMNNSSDRIHSSDLTVAVINAMSTSLGLDIAFMEEGIEEIGRIGTKISDITIKKYRATRKSYETIGKFQERIKIIEELIKDEETKELEKIALADSTVKRLESKKDLISRVMIVFKSATTEEESEEVPEGPPEAPPEEEE